MSWPVPSNATRRDGTPSHSCALMLYRNNIIDRTSIKTIKVKVLGLPCSLVQLSHHIRLAYRRPRPPARPTADPRDALPPPNGGPNVQIDD